MNALRPEQKDKLLTLYQTLHQNPELGYREQETTGILREFFEGEGIAFEALTGPTGGYVWIDAGKVAAVGYRSDIDALPVTECTGAPFASRQEGRMHACGHDMHMTIAAGVILLLWENRQNLNSNVLVVFQPAEELPPHGGAKAIAESGLLERCGVREMYGLHMWPAYPVGELAARPGTQMAAADEVDIEIRGKKSHAAEPHNGVDAIGMAADVVQALTQRLRREIAPLDSSVITLGVLEAPGAHNIVCDRAHLRGTMRTVSEETRTFLKRRIGEICRDIAASWRGEIEANIIMGYDVVHNDPALHRAFAAFAADALGEDKVHTGHAPSLVAEDFSAFGKRVPSLFVHMGCGGGHALHTSQFLPDPRVLEVAAPLFAAYLASRG